MQSAVRSVLLSSAAVVLAGCHLVAPERLHPYDTGELRVLSASGLWDAPDQMELFRGFLDEDEMSVDLDFSSAGGHAVSIYGLVSSGFGRVSVRTPEGPGATGLLGFDCFMEEFTWGRDEAGGRVECPSLESGSLSGPISIGFDFLARAEADG